MNNTPKTITSTLKRTLGVLLGAGLATSLAGQALVLDNERLSPGHFPAFDGWEINMADRAKVVVQDYGLTYDVADGKRIEGGVRSVLIDGDPNDKMNNWLELPLEPPTETMYFSVVLHPETIGTNADPMELFIRFGNNWNAYFALKLYEGILETAGASLDFADAGTTGDLAGMNHLLVGQIVADEEGNITEINAWLNPSAADMPSPILTSARPGTHSLEAIDVIQVRSQNTATVIDNFTLGATFAEVVPPLPEDPGDITLTLPEDQNEGEPGIQVAGGTLFVTVDGEPYEADTVLPVGTVVTYEAVPNAGWELTRWNGTVHTGDTLEIPVYSTTNISPVFEFGDIRVTLKPGMGGDRMRIQVQGAGGGWSNTTRTLFDIGEVIRVDALEAPFFRFSHWRGDFEPLNAGLDPFNPSRVSPALTVGSGILENDVVVESTAYFNIRQYVVLEAEDAMGIGEIDYDFTEAGAPGTLPAAVMNEILAEKVAAGVAGVLTGRQLVEYGPVAVDPTVDLSTPSPEGFIIFDEETGEVTDSQLFEALDYHLVMGDRTIVIRPGDQRYVEMGGAANLATADGPGPMSEGEMVWIAGKPYRAVGLNVDAGGRRETTPPISIGGTSSWDFEFDAEDKVVMAGMTYLSRNNWQFHNPNNDVRLWADAVLDDGSTLPQLSSPNMVQGDEANHFLGFIAPEGRYITNIRVWHRGGNGRSFSNVDDLVVILEGDPAATYALDLDGRGGSVDSVPAGPHTEGTTVTLAAIAGEPGSIFGGWVYDAAPGQLISSSPLVDLTVRSNLAVTGIYKPFGVELMAAGEELVFTTAVGLNYQLEGSADLESWAPVGDPIAGDGEEVSLILGGAEPGSGLYYRIGVSIAD